ncbi:hypothetical protein PIB30_097723 [Stylosanthes scabra]|uniref:Uncharacterized protein n=1 Tax=Stylosanthes scabra TaxID=79078 RepID=A0ABU6XT55_9FABA|nr:hypothetical protein [Stylosanthes scabra]
MNQERMRYDQILQEAAAQLARERNKSKAREVVPDYEEEFVSSEYEEWYRCYGRQSESRVNTKRALLSGLSFSTSARSVPGTQARAQCLASLRKRKMEKGSLRSKKARIWSILSEPRLGVQSHSSEPSHSRLGIDANA